MKLIEEMGGAVAARFAYMKSKLVESNTKRLEAIESGEQVVIGVNRFTDDRTLPPHDRRGFDHDG